MSKRWIFQVASCQELRRILVMELLENPARYSLTNSTDRKLVKKMRNPGQQLLTECLLAASYKFGIEIRVYHGANDPIVFKGNGTVADGRVIYLHCISLIHYNPIRPKNLAMKEKLRECNVNVIYSGVRLEQLKENVNNIEDDVMEKDEEFVINLSEKGCVKQCCHRRDGLKYERSLNNYCCMVDTGAEVSLITRSAVHRMMETEPELQIVECENKLRGIGGVKTEIEGCIYLDFDLFGIDVEGKLPFAVMDCEAIPCCFLLGANFIRRTDLIIDYSRECFYLPGNEKKFQLGKEVSMSCLTNVVEDDCKMDTDNSEEEEEVLPKFKFIIDKEELESMQ